MKEKIGPILWLMVAALIIGASIGFSARANAAPDDVAHAIYVEGQGICDMYEQTGVDQMTTIAIAIAMKDNYGLTDGEAGQVIVHSVVLYCNELNDELVELIESTTS